MIQPHSAAPVGIVKTLPSYTPETFSPTSAILCRNTAPLIAFAFACIQRGVGVRVLGRDIGQGLVTTIKDCKATSLDELEVKLIQRRNREAKACRQQGNEQGAAAVEDKYDCLNIFLNEERKHILDGSRRCFLTALTTKIENLFDEKLKGLLTLSTVHKAKGLEWPDVFILDARRLMPSKWANLPWQKVQEKNLQYVAITRAKLNLYYITSDCWRLPAIEPQLSSDPSADLSDEADHQHQLEEKLEYWREKHAGDELRAKEVEREMRREDEESSSR